MKNFINRMFYPKSIAIIEASSKRPWQVQGIIEQNFKGDLYLISKKEEEIFGIKCYKDVSDIPDGIDHAILAVNRNKLKSLVVECIEKKFRTLHIFTAGGSEFDEKGEEIEYELYEIINRSNTATIGPNCMGIYCPEGRISYSPLFSKEIDGSIAFVSHSGDITTQYVMMENSNGVKFSKVASIGNSIDLKIADFINYYNEDEKTKIISVYFEGLSRFDKNDGKKLLAALRNTKKPVLFLRGGTSEVGKRSILSHTGTIASSNDIWNAIFKQTNTIKLDSYEDLLDNTAAFYFYKDNYPKVKSILLIVWSGGKAVLSTDAISALGIDIPEIKEPKKTQLKEMISIGSVENPLDLPWIFRQDKFIKICKLAMEEDYIGGIILEVLAPKEIDDRFLRVFNNIVEVSKSSSRMKKPFFLSLPFSIFYDSREELKNRFIKNNIAVFPSIFRAARSFLKMYEYQIKLNKR
ncbi:MAG: CoA-binding protein [Candidatus Helarchaeota archaeon]